MSVAPFSIRVAAVLLVSSVSACAREQPAATPVGSREQPLSAASPWQAIVSPFEEPRPYKPHFGEREIPPPDLNAETWRVLVNQTQPMQRKTPRWQPLSARAAVELEMPPRSSFRCVVAPLRVEPEGDDTGAGLESWHLKRSVLCSADAFRTWSETLLHVRLQSDGARRVIGDGGALLREHADDGSVAEMFVLMRTDKEQTQATIGPPRIIVVRSAGPD